VLALTPEGRSNATIAEWLVVTQRSVEAQIRQIHGKLDLRESPDDRQRLCAYPIVSCLGHSVPGLVRASRWPYRRRLKEEDGSR
jgi:hypothetical protein